MSKSPKKSKSLTRAGNRPATISAQQTIPYVRMLPDGICQLPGGVYTKTLEYEDINYSCLLYTSNPLSYIRNEADILKFVNALITNTKGEGKEGDPFWTKAETLLYCALIAYIIFEGPAEDRNMNTLVDMISGMEVKEDDENYKNAVDYMFDGLAKRKPDCFAVKQYRKFKLSSGKTAKSILISCGARLAPFDIPQLREIMSYDELELDRMGDRRTATFFCISDTDSTYNFLVALAFSQMFNLLCERADNCLLYTSRCV